MPAGALALVERHYGAIPPSTPPAEATPVEPPQQAERRARFAKPVAADRAFWAWKSPPQRHPDWLAFHFLHEILLGGPSSRLYRRLVAEAEVAASVQGALSPLADPGLFEVFVALERGHGAAEAEAVIDEEIARLHREPPAAAELVKAKNRIETAFWADLETAEGKAEALGHWETTVGDHRELFALLARVPAVGADDLVRVARAYLLPAARTVVVAEPSGADAGDGGGDEGAEEAP